MTSSPTYIHFRVGWQLLGPESPGQWFQQNEFRTFWDKLNSQPLTAGYHDFSYQAKRCELAYLRGEREEGGKKFGKIVSEPDKLLIIEEWAESSVDEFANKVAATLGAWFECFPRTFFVIQECCLRALVQPACFDDSRTFIGDRVIGLGPRLKTTFSAMPFKIGFAASCLKPLAGQQLFIQATVSSWRDNRQVWVEVQGTAPLSAPLNSQNLEAARTIFLSCKSFLEDELLRLLSGYDTKENGHSTRRES